MTVINNYPGFEYAAEQLKKFITANNFFNILLKNGEIIHFAPDDPADFKKWLEKNNIENIK